MVIASRWFTVAEAAEYLRVSRRTIYKMTVEGRLPAFRIGQDVTADFARRSRQSSSNRVKRQKPRGFLD